MIWSKCPKSVYVAKADFYFCLWIKWNEGAHGRKSFMESLNVKSGPNVNAGLKCKVQNNKKIQETQTSVTSTMKAEQER